MPNNNLVLVGPMGAGKSAVGRQLAQILSRDFFDSDHAIVDRTGVDISYIFEKEGEEGFRKRETQIIRELVSKENIVLSTGGGTVVTQENRELISKTGTVIYLHASVEQQATRTKKTDNRPLLKTGNPKGILSALMKEREPHYRDISTLVVRTDGQKVGDVVTEILEKLNNKMNSPVIVDDVTVNTKNRRYAVSFHHKFFAESQNLAMPDLGKSVVITDENLDKLYRKHIEKVLNPVSWLVIPASEKSKSFEHYQWLLDQLLELGVKRDTKLIGIGGGVVGDITGFVAATYMRGMQLVHMPTSLLAMVDSSIGGKTGINLKHGKNLVGSIYQPHQVITDLAFLKTLPEKEYVSGLAEVIKYAFINKPEFLEYLEQNSEAIKQRDLAIMQNVVMTCAAAKAGIVEQDEQDFGVRMLLNLGHTFGHAIEKLQNYQGFSHGEAVAIGMCMAVDTSHELGHLDKVEVKRAKDLIKSFALPITWRDFNVEDILASMKIDKKNTSTKQRFILLKSLGEAYVDEDVDNAVIEKVLRRHSKQQ